MTRAEIENAIPHRPPMLLIDEIVDQGDDTIVCRKTFRDDEFFFQGHYPGQPIVPGVILCEAAMQAGAVLLSRILAGTAGVPVATRMSDVKFKRMTRPGDRVELRVRLDERLADAFFLTARVMCESKTVASFSFACTMAKT